MNLSFRTVTLSIISLLLFGYLLFIFIKSQNFWKMFLFLTILNFIFTTVFMSIVSICEVLNYELTTFYKFLIHRVEKCVFTINFTVVFGYWNLTMMGKDVMIFESTVTFILNTIIVHFLIGLVILFEVLTNKNRKYVEGKFYIDFFLLGGFMFVYNMVILILAQTSGIYIYTFLNKSFIEGLGYSIVLLAFYILSYLLYYVIYRRLNDGKVDYDTLMSGTTTIYDRTNSNNNYDQL